VNLDERSPSIVTRLSGDGSEASPLSIDIDLGSIMNVEGIAVASNLRNYGSLIIKGARVASPVSFDWEHNAKQYRNLLQNGGAELGTFSNTQPADGASDVAGWTIWNSTSGAGGTESFAAQLQFGFPIDWDGGNIVTPPQHIEEFTSRYFARIQRATTATAAYAGAFSLTPVAAVNLGETYKVTGKFRWPHQTDPTFGAVIFLTTTIAALVPVDTASIVLDLADVSNEWQDFEIELVITDPVSVRYIAVAPIIFNGNEGDYLDIDDVTLQRVETDSAFQNYAENIEDTGVNIILLDKNETQVRTLRFEFINDVAGYGYIDVGKIIISKNLPLCIAPPLNYTTSLGQEVDITSEGIPYLSKVRGTRRDFAVKMQLFNQGQLEELRKVIEDTESAQIYASLFGETRKTRALIGSFTGSLNIGEAPLPNFGDVSFTMHEER